MDREFLKFMCGFLFIGLFIISIKLMVIGIKTTFSDNNKENTELPNLFVGYSNNNFDVKTTFIKSINKKTITEENVLKNLQWAQLRLYPTIGCTHPTLFYLADNNQQVQMIEVDAATIIK